MPQTKMFDITFPPIDELLKKVAHEESAHAKEDNKGDYKGEMSSKFALATYSASRARQIVNYYSKMGAGIYSETFTDVQPLVDHYENENPLSIAMREIYGDCLDLTPGNKSVPGTDVSADTNSDASVDASNDGTLAETSAETSDETTSTPEASDDAPADTSSETATE